MMEEEEGGSEDDDPNMPGMVRIPMLAAIPGGSPFGMPGMSAPRRADPNEEEWVNFFTGLINMEMVDDKSTRRRIVLLESTAALAETFDVWWPHLLEAVRRRRRPVRKGKKSETLQPTTIVLSVPPSLLLPHTAFMMEPGGESADMEGQKDRLRSVVEALGASVSAIHVDGGGDKGEEKIWFSSEEHDIEGRQRREERRLRAILHNG